MVIGRSIFGSTRRLRLLATDNLEGAGQADKASSLNPATARSCVEGFGLTAHATAHNSVALLRKPRPWHQLLRCCVPHGQCSKSYAQQQCTGHDALPTRLPSAVRASTALNRQNHPPQRERQAIFLGSTEPRAARPERYTAGNTSRLCPAVGCQCNVKGDHRPELLTPRPCRPVVTLVIQLRHFRFLGSGAQRCARTPAALGHVEWTPKPALRATASPEAHIVA
jgi:hypothetical protein